MPSKPQAKFKRVVTWEVVPADAEADFDAVIKMIQGIKIPGVEWVGVPAVQPHVFGLSKIIITSDIVVDDDLTDKIKTAIDALTTA